MKQRSIYVIATLLVLTVGFGMWVGSVNATGSNGHPGGGDKGDGGDTGALIPACPSMNDRPCEVSGTYTSGNPQQALQVAKDKCNAKYDLCVTNQGTESSGNNTTCTGVLNCKFTSKTIDSPHCEGEIAANCTTTAGSTKCTVNGKYDITTYTCKKSTTPHTAPIPTNA